MSRQWFSSFRKLGAAVFIALAAIKSADAGVIHEGGFQYKGDIYPERTAILDTYKELYVEDEGVFSGSLHISVREKLYVAQSTASIPVFNLWGALIKVPQPIDLNKQLVDLFWIFGAGRGIDAGPLPPGSYLEEASVFGNNDTEYVSTISAINDLRDLPTSSDYDLSVVWNLNGLANTVGNFYLVKTTVPFSALTTVPEPATTWLLLSGLLAVLIIHTKMHARATCYSLSVGPFRI